MPNDNIRSDDHAVLSQSSISDSSKKRKEPDNIDLLNIAAILVALAGLGLGLITREPAMIVATNAPLIVALRVSRR